LKISSWLDQRHLALEYLGTAAVPAKIILTDLEGISRSYHIKPIG